MRKLFFLVLALPIMTACMQQVPAGHVGVKVYLAGSAKGVDHETLPVGRYYVGYNEQLYLFPTFQQNYVWTESNKEGANDDESIEFGAKGGVDVHANVGVAFHIDESKVADVFQKYREGVNEIRAIPLRNAVRNAFQKYGGQYNVEQLYTDKAQLLTQVRKEVKTEFDPLGIVIDDLSLVGNFKLPPAVTAALNAKIEATQKAQQRENEVAEAKAQAEKDIAQATGVAKSNQLKAASITPTLLEWERIQKWNGILPQITGGVTPMINLTNHKDMSGATK
jgi:regulator of protease activity HflC (stomatin/prohibitin superfamily)